jgi:aryl-alcohol dehydrogenase-like predicted oxidoreductase
MSNAASPPITDAGTITLGGDLTVNRLGFGAMRITGPGIWGEPRNRTEAIALLRRVVGRGVNFIDTADSYGPEVSERLIAEALHPYPATLVIATKGGLVRPGPDRWSPDCRPAHLRAACEGSLKRLKVECIDVYQLHTVDPRVPLEDSVGALIDLQRAGKIRHIGVSNVQLQQLTVARSLAQIVSVQNHYNLADRSDDALVDVCARERLAFLPWYPLAAGRLATPGSRLHEIAKRHNATPAQIALSWLLRRSPMMLPIPGTSSIEHFEENLAAASIRLTNEEFAALSR